ncbi:exopolyphosphatase [Streptomyces sp. NRRL S-146]|uniref:Ppx/GppA phosphatase family protein n=1 Tax=Streptomyces sp. NRRL S-146 TaxID=1463884 RepID=UPI0004C7B42F|nr:exopolyphosphatase [Streptomyces sp. NRRL S-146]
MRLGVLDVGSNTVHLLVVDAHPGACPLPAHSHKAELRLAQLLDDDGAIGPHGVDRLVSVIKEALQAAEDKGVEEVLPFATSAVREARNADDVLERVRAETGVELQVLTGSEEARLTFLAARRWFGWSAGKLLVLDIGGGSLEVAYGIDEELEGWVPRLAAMTEQERAELPGVSEGRAGQLLAGALVAEAAMDLFGVERVEICPWALREGVILRRLDHMESV